MEYSLRLRNEVLGRADMNVVLILILMEYSLRQPVWVNEKRFVLIVLILILMEYSLRLSKLKPKRANS